ncbi:MAG: YerC/YecD family TrpR-related protein [Alphaproteobacteria bacterium]|jgi:TrpR-related protein YerC/YecD
MEDDHHKNINDLCEAFLLLETKDEAYNFLKDLCTPQELLVLSERWRVCKLLEKGDYSYRDIHTITKASLTTIGRVARFLKNEPYHGYLAILNKIRNEENDKQRNLRNGKLL